MTAFSVVHYWGTRPYGRRDVLELHDLRELLLRCWAIDHKAAGPGWSPTRYLEQYRYTRDRDDGTSETVDVQAPAVHRRDEAVVGLSALVLDLDHARPDWLKLADLGHLVIAYTTWSHSDTDQRWRLVFPLAAEVPVVEWPSFWRSAVAYLDLAGTDRSCGDPSRFYYLHATSPAADPLLAETRQVGGRLLDPCTVPRVELLAVVQQTYSAGPCRPPTVMERYRANRLLDVITHRLSSMEAGGRQVAVYGAARALGHWVAAGALEADVVRDELWQASERNGLVLDGAVRVAETERAIRRGLNKGAADGAIDFAADRQARPARRSIDKDPEADS